MNQTILAILHEFDLDAYRPIAHRDLDLGAPLPPRAGNLVKVVSGMRRSGKTYRLFQEMDRLLTSGVPHNRICYFNFEDDRLGLVTPATGDEVLEAFRYMAGNDAHDEGLYLFFDEIQEMQDWGHWLRRIVDTTKATIYVSGSSSKLLSTEISTEFRGRALDFELLPNSFAEYLSSHGIAVPAERGFPLAPVRAAAIQAAFDEYLERGGFPAAQGLPKPQAVELLQSYVQRVVARDVVERHNIARPRVASALANRLMSLNGKQVSLRKIENDLRSAGIASGRGYLADLVEHFSEAYLIFTVREFSKSLSENTTAMPKVYAIDPGLALACSRAGASERGQRLENAVYLELRRRNPNAREGAISMFHTREHGYEVDFLIGDILDDEARQLIQVTGSMEDAETTKRELRALWEALEEKHLDEGLLIVRDGDSMTYEQDGRRIHQVPAYQWFLNAMEFYHA